MARVLLNGSYSAISLSCEQSARKLNEAELLKSSPRHEKCDMKPKLFTKVAGRTPVSLGVFSGLTHGADGGPAKARRDWQRYSAIVESSGE